MLVPAALDLKVDALPFNIPEVEELHDEVFAVLPTYCCGSGERVASCTLLAQLQRRQGRLLTEGMRA